MKVSSEDSTAFRKLNIDHNDDEDKVHWTEKTLEQLSTRDWSIWQEDFQIFIPGGQGLNLIQVLAESPLLWKLPEAVHTAGYAKPTQIQMQAHTKKLPLLDDTTAQDGPCAIILALRLELVTQIEEVLNQRNGFVFDEADKLVDIGFEVYVTRTLLAIPNTNMKVSSKDVPTVIQPQMDSTAFRKLNVDHNDDEGKSHWTEDFQIFIPGGQVLNPMRSWPRACLSGNCSRKGTPADYARPTPTQMQVCTSCLYSTTPPRRTAPAPSSSRCDWSSSPKSRRF